MVPPRHRFMRQRPPNNSLLKQRIGRVILAGTVAFIVVLLRQQNLLLHPASLQTDESASLLNANKGIAIATQGKNERIAILVGGSFQRYLLNSTLHHLLTPLVEKEHYHVDYFLLLTTTTSAAPPAYRADLPYMNHLQWDPIFGTQEETPSQDEIAARIRSLVQATGANLGSMRLLDTMKFTDARLEQKRTRAREMFPTEDVDLRFPMKDLRPKAMQRTANGNRNMLNLFFGLQLLWDDLVATEVSFGMKYNHVMILRDDTLWLQDFSMDKLVKNNKADAHVLSCDARVPPMLSHEINDHAIIVSRNKAAVLGRYYTSLFDADLEACAQAVKDDMGKLRGCNSEMILKWILKENSIHVQQVPQSMIPFQRSVNVLWNGKVVPCFHKYCQSQEAPLIADPSIKACKTLSF